MRRDRLTALFAIAALTASAAALAQDPPMPVPIPAPAQPSVSAMDLQTIAAPAAVPLDQALNNPEYMLALDLDTGGRVVVQLRPDMAPATVERVKLLARQGFYNGLIFHRVIEGFMAQGGDPQGNGEGGSSLPNIAAEFNALPHVRGVLSMARATEPNSANSQFFIMFLPRLTLDKNYTAFGRVVSGMQYVDAIQRGEPPANPNRIVQASVMADAKPVPPATALTPRAAIGAPVTAADLNAPLRN